MKTLDERNADLLEKLTLAFVVATFIGAETIGGSVLFAVAAVVCYLGCAYITLQQEDSSDDHS
ncbi:hypothetical protein NOG11_06655 [Parvularcula sp. BGMRC 0090]|uniref:Uncharacterized protein n=2 Tax=Parvularcula maris TaxID=2965077 RepID=A0A9X2RHP4_9PROT|nr:hypothetical protein [Parvularcula maris]